MKYPSHQQLLKVLGGVFPKSYARRRRSFASLLALLIFVLFCEPFIKLVFDRNLPKPNLAEEEVAVQSVLDGDTIVIRNLRGKKETIRLLGIDAPEAHENAKAEKDIRTMGVCMSWLIERGIESRTALRKMLPNNSKVALLFEQGPQIDQYGRKLAYVFTSEGELLNLKLVQEGLASPYFQEKHGSYRSAIHTAYREAKNLKLGMWKHKESVARECSRTESHGKYKNSK